MKKLASIAALLFAFSLLPAHAYVQATNDYWYVDVGISAYDWDRPWQDAIAAEALARGMDKLDVTSAYCSVNPIARVQYPWGALLIRLPPPSSPLGALVAATLSQMQLGLCMLNNAGFHK